MKSSIRPLLALLGFSALGLFAEPPPTVPPKPGAQVARAFSEVVTRTNKLSFLLYLPEDYGSDAAKKFPLLLFLHGAGERGTDLEKVTAHGPPKMAKEGRQFPFILVSPQCPAEQVWNDDALMGLLHRIESELRVDKRRVYATGLSMGGYGTWNLACRHPEHFAAVAPICGGGERIRVLLPAQREALKTLGIWAFHGAKDNVVPPSESERMVEEMKKAGVSDVQLTVYPEDGHDSWTHAYNEPKFQEWLLQHSR